MNTMTEQDVDPMVPAPAVVTVARRTALLIAAAVAFVVLILLGLLVTTRGDLNSSKDTLASFEQQERARLAVEAAFPDLEQEAQSVFGSELSAVADTAGGDALSLTFRSMTGRQRGLLRELLVDKLGFPTAIMARIGNTRALDGTLDAQGDKSSATWTYHPDAGLSLVIEVDR